MNTGRMVDWACCISNPAVVLLMLASTASVHEKLLAAHCRENGLKMNEPDAPRQKKHIADIPDDLDTQAECLSELVHELGCEIDELQSRRLVDYLVLMLKQNETMNLTAIREWDKALLLHLVDSLVPLPEFKGVVEKNPGKPFLDMGSGAGLPGIPLAITNPGVQGVLCDSVKKKMMAVEGFIGALGLGGQLSTTTMRLEELGAKRRGEFGCVTARALASLPVLVEYATPLLAKGGSFIAIKGKPEEEEVKAGSRAAQLCGLTVRSTRVVELPQEAGERTIIVYEKVAGTTLRLPRQVGEAAKHPLA